MKAAPRWGGFSLQAAGDFLILNRTAYARVWLGQAHASMPIGRTEGRLVLFDVFSKSARRILCCLRLH